MAVSVCGLLSMKDRVDGVVTKQLQLIAFPWNFMVDCWRRKLKHLWYICTTCRPPWQSLSSGIHCLRQMFVLCKIDIPLSFICYDFDLVLPMKPSKGNEGRYCSCNGIGKKRRTQIWSGRSVIADAAYPEHRRTARARGLSKEHWAFCG